MNEELKTLKDLKEYVNVKSIGGKFQYGWNNALDEVKLQAIKWVKELKELGILGCLNSQKIHGENMARRAQIEWIKNFFNMTKENLT